MKPHIDHYKKLERSGENRFNDLVARTPIEVMQEVAESGLHWHLIHYRNRFDELLQKPLSTYAKGRLWVAKGILPTMQGPKYNGNDLLMADQFFAESVRKGEKVGPSLHNRAIFQVMLGDVKAAELFFKQAIAEDHRESNLGLGSLQTTPADQERLYRLAFPTDDPNVSHHFGSWLTQAGRMEEARKYLEEAVSLGLPAVMYRTAQLKKRMGEEKAAIEDMVGAVVYRAPEAPLKLREWGLHPREIQERIEQRWLMEENS